MPAFGLNQYSLPYVMGIFDKQIMVDPGTPGDPDADPPIEPVPPTYNKVGFRLTDRQLTAVDEFVGGIIGRFQGLNNNYMGTPVNKYGWNRWLFMYLFIGGVEWAHSIDITGNYSTPIWSGTITHNQNGFTCGTGGKFDTQCDLADVTGNAKAWNRRAQGFYLRTNNPAVSERCLNAQIVYTPNGYTYWQGIIPGRTSDNSAYSDFCCNTNASVPATNYNRITAPAATSHGFWVQSRTAATDHRFYRNGAQVGATDVATEIGMGGSTHMTTATRFLHLISSTRNFCFLFSTKHTHALTTTEVTAFNFFVQRLQKGLQRNV